MGPPWIFFSRIYLTKVEETCFLAPVSTGCGLCAAVAQVMPVVLAKVAENRLLARKSDVLLTDDDELYDVPGGSEIVFSEACFLI